MLELLQERVTLFSDLAEVMGGHEVMLPPNSRNVFRADTPQAPRGEQLLTQAITEGEGEMLNKPHTYSLGMKNHTFSFTSSQLRCDFLCHFPNKPF